MKNMEDRLFADLAASFANAALRVNRIVDRGFSVDSTVSAGGQVIDAVLELWLPQGTHDAVAQRLLSQSLDIGIIWRLQSRRTDPEGSLIAHPTVSLR